MSNAWERQFSQHRNTYFAGIRRSSITSFPPPPSAPFVLVFFDCTLTTTLAGLRSPTRTSSDMASASVIVALNKPVRRCFGRCVRIRVSVWWNPRSRSLGSMDQVLQQVDLTGLHCPHWTIGVPLRNGFKIICNGFCTSICRSMVFFTDNIDTLDVSTCTVTRDVSVQRESTQHSLV